MANLNPPPCLPDIILHKVTKGEINFAHAPQSSTVCAAEALVLIFLATCADSPLLTSVSPLQERQPSHSCKEEAWRNDESRIFCQGAGCHSGAACCRAIFSACRRFIWWLRGIFRFVSDTRHPGWRRRTPRIRRQRLSSQVCCIRRPPPKTAQ